MPESRASVALMAALSARLDVVEKIVMSYSARPAAVTQRSFSAAQNPIAAPPAGTTLDEITFDTSAAALTATLYAPVPGLDTRIKVTGPNALALSPPSGFTFDATAGPWTFNSKDAYTFAKNPVSATDIQVS